VLDAISKLPMFAKVTEAWVYPCDNSDCAEHASEHTALKYRRSASGPWQRGGGEE
jgi:hypothetical protein